MFDFPFEVGEVSVDKLKGTTFLMPSYQRGYRWRQKQIQSLIDDLYEKWESGGGGEYLLQPIVVQRSCCENLSGVAWNVIDGQQRLRTLNQLIKGYDESDLWTILPEDCKHYADERLTQLCLDNCFAIARLPENSKKLSIIKNNLSRIKFIYYKIGDKAMLAGKKKTTNDVFEDLNANKIDLTDSELVRALFFSSSSEDGDNELAEIAAEWEMIESRLQDDAFWYMFNRVEPKSNTRIDSLFAIVTNTEKSDSRLAAFHDVEKMVRKAPKKADALLANFWDKVLGVYWMLQCCYNDIHLYHYIGWIRHQTEVSFETLYRLYKADRSAFCNNLRKIILGQAEDIDGTRWDSIEEDERKSLKTAIRNISGLYLKDDDYFFDKGFRYLYKPAEDDGYPVSLDSESVRRKCKTGSDVVSFLLIFNLEYLNQTFDKTRDIITRGSVDEWSLQGVEYYRYPFALHKNQVWNLEHVGSHTDTAMVPETELKECLEWAIEICKEKMSMNERAGDDFLRRIVQWIESKKNSDVYLKVLERAGITDFKLEDAIAKVPNYEPSSCVDFEKLYEDWIKPYSDAGMVVEQREKNHISNIVLLDERTNKSYQNAIFPRKRREMLHARNAASGDEFRFVPPCTVDVLCKNYTPTPTTLEIWTKQDMKYYEQRLIDVFKTMWIEAGLTIAK